MLICEVASLEESSGSSLEGSFTQDLVFSKYWLMHELARIQPHVSTMYVLGSWYGNLAMYLNRYPMVKVDHIVNVETDQERLNSGKHILNQMGVRNVEHMLKDANKLDYRQLDGNGVVVNTSLTEMPDTDWFKHIPPGTLVVLQARDHNTGETFAGPEDIQKKFPLDQMLYSGSLNLRDPETEYSRFMTIGIK
jgi:hypothetical protein